jgi:hypothetical protein
MKRSKAIISGITLACAIMLCSSANAFENDPAALGEWKAVDFVESISAFNPEIKSFKDDLFMKKFEFHEGGSTHQNGFTWTKGVVHYVGDKWDGKYVIKKIDGKDYLFLEWINGDVINRGEKPKYYVFKRK